MKVKVKVRPSGLVNGQQWPEVGTVLDVPDHIAEGMIAAGHLARLKAEQEARPTPDLDVETRPAVKPRTAPAKKRRAATPPSRKEGESR